MKITVADYCIQFLISKGIRMVPGIPGGTILPIYDALAEHGLGHILARHEQAAGFIAGGMARSSGQVAACLVSSGPGVANLVTAVSDAYSDSVPLIILSGQVPRSLLGTDAFQELPTRSIVSHFTKASYLVLDENELPRILHDAYQLAASGRPGPVWIDIPKDVQTAEIEDFHLENLESLSFEAEEDSKEVDDLLMLAVENSIELFRSAKKPLFYIGGGAKDSTTAIQELVKICNAPVVSTLMALGMFQKHDPQFLGMMGMHGTVDANLALGECDLLIALGVRFDDRATGNINSFCPDAKIIHIDIDPREIGKNKKVDVSWNGDLHFFLKKLVPKANKLTKEILWYSSGKTISQQKENEEEKRISLFFGHLSSHFHRNDFIITDVGQHQMWTAQFFSFPNERSWITSGGQGTMGFGLPTSIGVALTHPDSTVLCITGDGSIMMNLQELATLRELNLNVKIILLNNGHLGLVRQQQELFYGNRRSGSVFEFQPNFQKLAESFDIRGMMSMLGENMDDTVKFIFEPGPCLLELLIPNEVGVYPFVPGGKSNQEFILDSTSTIESKTRIENELCNTK